MIYHGDLFDVLPTLEAESIDACVTDPPYGLEFMGKDWDRPWAVSSTSGVGFSGRENNLTLPMHRDNRNANCRTCGGRQRGAKRCSCDSPNWDRHPNQDMSDFQAWSEKWAREVLRVLKPGAYLLAFGGTRTYHRMTCAIEDAGFEIRDSLCWLYGSGFPKSLDVSKAIDKAAPRVGMFDGFAAHFKQQRLASGLSQKDIASHFPSKTGGLTGCVWNWENGANVPTRSQWDTLAPMLGLSSDWLPLIERVEAEREVLLRSDNGIAGGTGQHAGEIGAYGFRKEFDVTVPATEAAARWAGWGTALKPAYEPIVLARKPLIGTVAENVLTHGTGAINIDACRIEAEAGWQEWVEKTARPNSRGQEHIGAVMNRPPNPTVNVSPLGRWPANALLDEIAAEMLDDQSGELSTHPGVIGDGGTARGVFGVTGTAGTIINADRGGASRFFYVAKPSREERNAGIYGEPDNGGGQRVRARNSHPT